MKQSRSEYIDIRGVRHHVRRWGVPDAPTLFMLHGWQDMSATFQVVVDRFTSDFNVIAPDWRGFGQSEWGTDPYYLTEYVVSLDQILELYSPNRPAAIVGHSMGGNIAGLYAGTRPERVSHFVNIEGYAPVPGFGSDSVPEFLGRWLKHRRTDHQISSYPDRKAVARYVAHLYPRRSDAEIDFLIKHLARERPDGLWQLNADPRSRFVVAIPPAADQIIQLWSNIAAEVLCLRGERSFVTKAFADCPGALHNRLKSLPRGREIVIKDAGHNVHHDCPAQVASLIERFMTGGIHERSTP